jgi:hypothetical protein
MMATHLKAFGVGFMAGCMKVAALVFLPWRVRKEWIDIDRWTQARVDEIAASRRFPPRDPKAETRHWAVMVHRNGEDILTIESNHLSGKPEFSPEDEQCIRDCAQHLLAFIGEPPAPDPRGDQIAALHQLAWWTRHHSVVCAGDRWRATVPAACRKRGVEVNETRWSACRAPTRRSCEDAWQG